MVERRPALTLLSHLVLALGVLIIVFPVYMQTLTDSIRFLCESLHLAKVNHQWFVSSHHSNNFCIAIYWEGNIE